MKKRYVLALFLASLLALALLTTPVSAYYTGIKGDLKDMKTLDPWMHGAVVTVSDIDGNDLFSPVTLSPGVSSFNISQNFSSAPAVIIVEVDFMCEAATGCDGGEQPADATFFGLNSDEPEIDEGVWDTGTYLADTGPNAVSLAGLSGTSGLALMGVLPLAAVAGLGAVKLNRKKQQ
jgi:hypothetical protein